jgi:aminoglycoside 3-N-acetyltransferase
MASGIADTMTKSGRRVAGGIVRRLKRARQKLVSLDQKKVLEALKSCAPVQDHTLLVHSSLSSCGYITEGPATVIAALRAWLAEGVGLALPTHTWSYPNASGVTPVYDYQVTPSVVGTITNYYRDQPGVVRSLHPSHSIAYSGPEAQGFVDGHELCETPCGHGTPYERLIAQDGSVLMFGATLDAYTLFHTAEDAAQVPYLYLPKQLILRSRDRKGEIREIPTWRQDMGVKRRFAAMDPWLEAQGLLLRRKLGLGELLYIPRAAALHDRIVHELRQDPLLLVAESARPGIRDSYVST